MSKHASYSGPTFRGLASIRNTYNRKAACWYSIAIYFAMLAWCPASQAQTGSQAPASAEEVKQLREVVQSLLVRVTELENELKKRQPASLDWPGREPSTASFVRVASTETMGMAPGAVPAVGDAATATLGTGTTAASAAESSPATIVAPQSAALDAPKDQINAADRAVLDYLHGATLNFMLDEYYEYNFNDPVGRVNALRAYDVLSNNISLNQADLVFERAPDVDAGQRFGMRVDLQFGQATDTLQGNPLNEPRPDIYRNIFQAYGTYVAPIGNGLTIDVGKWGSSIGIEGNYTKDQMNYSRAYWFDFLPFYHMGVRAAYKVNDKLTLNYWVVNGTNQAEATNGFKDELFGFTAAPTKKISWTVNYYLGQEHPDRTLVASSGPVPVQPGLTFQAITPAPNGKLHIFDSYVTWQVVPKLTVALEGDYVIEREWENTNTVLGESSAPSHDIGGAAYVKYQFSPKFAVAGRTEYLSDRGGLFSGTTQALKETTATFDYKLSEGFLMRYEWRRDWSNQPSFFSDKNGVLSKEQQTLGVGIVWWVGRKEGAW
jgi:Putative beta-barrel porin-2, OmpL-like. bbp2